MKHKFKLLLMSIALISCKVDGSKLAKKLLLNQPTRIRVINKFTKKELPQDAQGSISKEALERAAQNKKSASALTGIFPETAAEEQVQELPE